MTMPHRYGVTFSIVGTTDSGWELIVASRKADGAYWAIVNDGLMLHECRFTRTDANEAAEDVLGLAGELAHLAMETKAHPAARAGVN